jgi:hypothetical protein
MDFSRSKSHALTASIEFLHPVSSLIFGKFEKMLLCLEHYSQKRQIAICAFGNNGDNIFEPSLVIIPCLELRLRVTIHAKSNEEPICLEFGVDLAALQLGNSSNESIELRFVIQLL